MPTLYPADPAEALVHGMHAVELSRASGLWSAMKVVTAMADGASTALVSPSWQAPDLSDLPGGLRAYGHQPRARLLGAELAELERSQQLTRLPIAVEYIRRSGLNVITGPRSARIGLVAAGKTYLDVRQALTALGLTEADLERHGIRLLKLGVIYPVEPTVVAEFAAGLDEIIVIEDKRAFLEDAVKSVLYGRAGAPAVYGKRSRDGSPLFSAVGELDADSVADALARHFEPAGIPDTRPAAPRSGSCCRWRSACRTSAPAARTTRPPRSRPAPSSAAGSAATRWWRSCRKSRSARSSGCARWAARARSGWASRRS